MAVTRRAFGRMAALGAAMGLAPGVLRPAGAAVRRSHGLSAFGDLKYGPHFTAFDYVNPAAPVGGTFSTGTGDATFDSLHPFILKGYPALGLQLLFDPLMERAWDEPDAMYGLLAGAVEEPEDRAWIAFDLRPEARFADGSPVTADDVVFTFETLLKDGHPSYRIDFAGIERAVAEGSGRVRFDFVPDAPKRDLGLTVGGMAVLSRAWWQGRDFTESSLEAPLGSGPYMVEAADPGRSITYRRRTDYWAADLPVNRGRYRFERMRYEYFRDRTATFEGFKAGAYTHHEEFWAKQWATGYDFPAVTRGDITRRTLPDGRPSGAQGYWLNLRRPQFADPRVREAIGLCFDFEWSNRTLFFDAYQRTVSFFQNGPMMAEGMPGPGELTFLEELRGQIPDAAFGPAHLPNVTDGSGRNRAGVSRAGALLDAAGWTVQGGNRRNAAGEILTVEFLDRSPEFERITNPYVKALERLGIQASLRMIDQASYKRRVDEFDFDIVTARRAMALTPGGELRAYFHSSSAGSPGSLNLAGLADPAVDRLLDAIERAESRETLTDAVRALDRVLRALHIWVPQWNKGSHTIAHWDIYAWPETKPAYAPGYPDTWWIDAEKHARLQPTLGG